MHYQLPLYPSNRLETLMHLEVFQRDQLFDQLKGITRMVGCFMPVGHVLHVGKMVMSTLATLAQHRSLSTLTLIYDQSLVDENAMIGLSLDEQGNHIVRTNFGHTINIISSDDSIPQFIEELCCMVHLYCPVQKIIIHTTSQPLSHTNISEEYPTIWLGSHLHQGLNLETSLIQDRDTLTQLTMGQHIDLSATSGSILQLMRDYYGHLPDTYSFAPLHYHTTAMLDGQTNHTSGYCAGIIV